MGNAQARRSTPDWTPQQEVVFDWCENGDRSANVIARAGTGKSTTIVHGARYCEGKTLVAAFNKSAAEELKSRLPATVDAKTGHGLGMGLIIQSYGKPTVDENKAKVIIGDILVEMGRTIVEDGELVARTAEKNAIAKLVSRAKNTLMEAPADLERLAYMMDLVEDESGRSASLMADVTIKALARCLDQKDVIDFDDMPWIPVKMGLRPQRYDTVLVDEAQDTNACSRTLYEGVMKSRGRFGAVGDDRQAIYAFRGADSTALDLIAKAHNSIILPLTVTFRCGKNIVQHVKHIVPDYEAAPGNEDGVVRVGSAFDARPGDFVIARSNAPLVRRCVDLVKAGVPAMVLGRDLQGSAEAMIRRSRASDVRGLESWVVAWSEKEATKLAKKGYDDLAGIIRDKASMLLALCEGAESIAEVSDRVRTIFGEGDAKTRVVFGTAHRMKGLERDRVFVLESGFRLDAQPGSQESNLYYVACTRALHELVLDQTQEVVQ
mgnify:CR=1 FL=1